jgi:hypothetical protein
LRFARVDKFAAAVLDYNGCGEVARVECFDKSKPVFYFENAKSFDIECCVDEMKDEGVSVYLPAFLRSWQKIEDLIEQASFSGVWNRPKD